MSAVVATLGVFDGFHRGHRAVAERAVVRARAEGATAVAFTFDVPPRVVLQGSGAGPLLSSLGERVGLLRSAGLDEIRVLRFDERLAAKEPDRFLDEHVHAFAALRGMVVGYDFAFGKDRQGTVAYLSEAGRRSGYRVDPVEAILEGGAPVSSSRIRNELLAGDVEGAARSLGRVYRLTGRVVPGDGRGKSLGFPTANLATDPRRVLPGQGVYAVWVEEAGRGTLPGVANLGERPTFGGRGVRLEVHVLAPVGELRGRLLGVAFGTRLRREHKFSSAKALKDQIGADAEAARAFLGSPAGSALRPA